MLSQLAKKKAYAGHRSKTIRDVGTGSATHADYLRTSDEDSFEAIRARCTRTGSLWEDPDFPANNQSLFYNQPPTHDWKSIQWKRPHDICADPRMFVNAATRGDVRQGVLGDCWLLAALASLTTNQTLLNRVIPQDQSFSNKNHGGVFRFYFWQYGRWVEVLVDDRLPTIKNKLIYMHSNEPNEFWSALLEKAIAKLNGSYEALVGGLMSEALTDFTGGVVVHYDLNDTTHSPQELQTIVTKAFERDALMGCSIKTDDGDETSIEQSLANGLVVGHAYSMTGMRTVAVNGGASKMTLIRARNPWGDSHEWNGAWSDKSKEWNAVSEDEKRRLGLTFDNDGEFWMSVTDFLANFDQLEICYLGPDSMLESIGVRSVTAGGNNRKKCKGKLFEGTWKRRVNAGGCCNHKTTFWTNPQYQITVVPEIIDDDGSLIISLMQKNMRKLRCDGKFDMTIGYCVYEAPVDNKFTGTLPAEFFRTHRSVASSGTFSDLREISRHHRLKPGSYVVVPSTYEPNEEGDFILRIFSERKTDSAGEIDETTSIVKKSKSKDNTEPTSPLIENGGAVDLLKISFFRIAGDDEQVDAFELHPLLNSVFAKEFTFGAFGLDMARSMAALYDSDRSGKLSYPDFKRLWNDLKTCSKTFRAMDLDQNGYFDSFEFRTAIMVLGFKVSNAMFSAIALRYSDREGRVMFDDFVAAYIRLKTLFDTFGGKDPKGTNKATFTLEEFSTIHIYS